MTLTAVVFPYIYSLKSQPDSDVSAVGAVLFC